MTILEVTARPFGTDFRGGGERYPTEMARALARRERVVFASVPGPRPTDLPGLESVALSGWSLSAPPLFSNLNPLPTPRTWFQIQGLLRAHSSDLEFLHLHNLRTAFTAAWLRGAETRPFRSAFRVILTDYGARFMPFPRQWLRGVDFYAAVSEYSLHQLQGWAPRPGVVVPVFVPDGLLRRADLSLDRPRDIDLLYLGRLVPWKRADLLLELLPRIERSLGRALHVVIAGFPTDPVYVDRLRFLAAGGGSRGPIEFVLRPDDEVVASLYARSRLFVLLSTAQNTRSGSIAAPELAGFTTVEAAAFGTPAVVSNIPGLSEQVVPGRTGLLVDPDRPDGVAERIAMTLSDDAAWRALSRGAAEFVRTERTVDRVTGLFEEFLQRIRRGAL